MKMNVNVDTCDFLRELAQSTNINLNNQAKFSRKKNNLSGQG